MSQADELSFKVEQAKQWKADVEHEVEETNKVLEQVAIEVQTQPYEDDTIMVGLKNTGEALASAFKALAGNFKITINALDPIVNTLQNTLKNLLSGLADMTRKIGQDNG